MKAEPILIKGLQKVEEEITPLFHNLMVEEDAIKRKEIWEQIQHKWREECRYIGDEIIKEREIDKE
jgi:hypothetical protein